MSIKYGLITELTNLTDGAGSINFGLNTSTYDEKLATSFVFGGNYYSASDKLNNGAKYPLKYDFKALNRKKYTYSLAVYDSVTKELVDSISLNYEVLYNNLSTNNYTINKNNSLFNIVFHDLPKKELALTVRIRGDNYLTTYAQVSTNNTTTNHLHNIGMVNINNLPDGVGIVNTVLQQNNNGTTQEYVLNFPSSSTKYEESSITIPQGTKFYDSDHNLLEGPISVKIGHFSPTTAYNLFSPGWNVPSLEYNGETLHNVNFVSGGYYSIDIVDSSGRSAKTIF